ncbi:MAG: tetratricopeptide repeat protein [Bacteroidales bacterium]|jgi:tetratricopeptide (TPR) repeat protein|nr:tetratricopeptide repeat protein [Bacteroidales bacterium]
MKKLIVTLAALAVAFGSAFAQDLAAVTEIYNAGAEAVSAGEKENALKSFEEALKLAEALGEEGQEVVANCKNIIPNLKLSLAKDLVKASKFDEAITALVEAEKVAEEYEAFSVADEAKGLVPQVKLSKANGLYKAKEYDAAAAAFQEILDADPTNGTAAFYKGAALLSAGKTEEAKAAFELAAANGQEANANKQLGNIYLKEASADLKAKKYADAVAAAVKAYELGSNAQALQLAGQASQAAGKNNDAIKYFEQYLEAAPTASNAGAIAYTVGALYQTAKNNTKAKEFYTKAASDPKYGAEAKKMLEALK